MTKNNSEIMALKAETLASIKRLKQTLLAIEREVKTNKEGDRVSIAMTATLVTRVSDIYINMCRINANLATKK